jgi:hypothetical protein
MGEVYKARHRRLDKLVALKLLPAGAQSCLEIVARFQREMKAIGALDHPNVVEAHDAGEQSGVVYLAMKLIDGIDLNRLIKERGPLPIAEVCELVRQAALGLHYLHGRGLVHRDVKPSNLMRTSDGTVKVLELGLARLGIEARAGHDLTGAGQVLGTPDFLAPEQIENAGNADARSDLYGLGGTLFYLLTGRAPFADHKSLFSKLEAHRSGPPPDVRTLRSEVPAELAALAHRLLAKKPEDRFNTAAEVAAALAPFAGTFQPPVEHAARPRANHWKRKLAIALTVGKWGCSLKLAFGVAVAVLVGLPVSWWLNERKEISHKGVQLAQQQEAAQQIRLTIDVLHRPAPDRNLRPGMLGVEAYDPRFGDAVTVKAQLDPPAYAFLIAFRPDGIVEGILPDNEDQAPQRKDSISAEYELNDGAGLEVFAVVASSQPLPSFKVWRTRCGKVPWGKFDGFPGVVWRADGVEDVEDLYESGRGKPKGMTGRRAFKELVHGGRIL